MKVNAYGAYAGDKPLEPLKIIRRKPGAHDIQIDIAYCGVCHSDLHQGRVRKLVLLALVAWVTWASSLLMRWAHMLWLSLRLNPNARLRKYWVPMK